MKKLFFIFVLPLSLLAQQDFKIEPLDGHVNTFGAELNFIQINDTLAFYTSFQDEGSYQSSIYFTTKRNKKWGKGKYSKYNSELFDTGDISFLNDDIIAFVPSRHLEKEDGSKIKKGEEVTFKIIEFNKEFKRVVASHTVLFKEQEMKNVKRATKKITASNADKATLGDLDALASLKEKMDNDK